MQVEAVEIEATFEREISCSIVEESEESRIVVRSDFARTYCVNQHLIDIAVAAVDMSACCLPII